MYWTLDTMTALELPPGVQELNVFHRKYPLDMCKYIYLNLGSVHFRNGRQAVRIHTYPVSQELLNRFS